MNITGGNFGTTGKISISRSGKILIKGAKKAEYQAGDLRNVAASTSKEKSFAVVSFILGAIVFSGVGFLILGLLGAVIGLVLATVASFYTTKTTTAEIEFTDGSRVQATTTPGELKRLYKLTP